MFQKHEALVMRELSLNPVLISLLHLLKVRNLGLVDACDGLRVGDCAGEDVREASLLISERSLLHLAGVLLVGLWGLILALSLKFSLLRMNGGCVL